MNEIEDLAELTLWHSHPNGGVGPSRIDMQQRLPHFEHLVVTLDSGRVLFTWY
jgi:proteasome lid subunit RPN8/RPN11